MFKNFISELEALFGLIIFISKKHNIKNNNIKYSRLLNKAKVLKIIIEIILKLFNFVLSSDILS